MCVRRSPETSGRAFAPCSPKGGAGRQRARGEPRATSSAKPGSSLIGGFENRRDRRKPSSPTSERQHRPLAFDVHRRRPRHLFAGDGSRAPSGGTSHSDRRRGKKDGQPRILGATAEGRINTTSHYPRAFGLVILRKFFDQMLIDVIEVFDSAPVDTDGARRGWNRRARFNRRRDDLYVQEPYDPALSPLGLPLTVTASAPGRDRCTQPPPRDTACSPPRWRKRASGSSSASAPRIRGVGVAGAGFRSRSRPPLARSPRRRRHRRLARPSRVPIPASRGVRSARRGARPRTRRGRRRASRATIAVLDLGRGSGGSAAVARLRRRAASGTPRRPSAASLRWSSRRPPRRLRRRSDCGPSSGRRARASSGTPLDPRFDANLVRWRRTCCA